jgi:RNA polymerase-binding transcription factor DksA
MSSIARLVKHNQMVENALRRVDNNVYGVCVETGNLISAERLRAVPTTTLSLEGKRIREI